MEDQFAVGPPALMAAYATVYSVGLPRLGAKLAAAAAAAAAVAENKQQQQQQQPQPAPAQQGVIGTVAEPPLGPLL
eukprot:SAG22_NODE_276_length_13167_cov_8.415825_8_plen_76_part_00